MFDYFQAGISYYLGRMWKCVERNNISDVSGEPWLTILSMEIPTNQQMENQIQFNLNSVKSLETVFETGYPICDIYTRLWRKQKKS